MSTITTTTTTDTTDRARSSQPQGPETAPSATPSESQLRDRLEFHFSTVVVQPVVCRICLAG